MKKYSLGISNNMKLYVSALLLFFSSIHGKACVSEGGYHNNYLFSVFHRSLMDDRFTAETNVFWTKYLGIKDNYFTYSWRRSDIMTEAKKRNDKELMAYMNLLNAYIDSNNMFNGWEYPTKAQINGRNKILQKMLTVSQNYKGKRLEQQYCLLKMRALFGLKRYQDAMDYWQKTASRQPQSVYRDMMRNIYAGCLLRKGERRQAVDIYAEQEDFRSLKYCVRNYRNVAGIQKVFNENPNSPTLNYLVQDFVNNFQETEDVFVRHIGWEAESADSDKVEWIHQLGAREVYRKDANSFIAFARQVVKNPNVVNPCLWQSAIGCLEHQMGLYSEAKNDLAAALKMNGTQRMRDNARAIYAINSVQTEKMKKKYNSWLTGELQWLDEMSKRDVRDSVMTDDHYHDVKERLVYCMLIPRLRSLGKQNEALTMFSMMEEDAPWVPDYRSRKIINDYHENVNFDYSNEYYSVLDKLSTKQLMDYLSYLKKRPKDVLYRYAWDKAYREADYYNDLIGTKLLAQARYSEAISYLERVDLGFIRTQNILPYEVKCNWNVERWMQKQYTGEFGKVRVSSLKSNKKLDYCKELLDVQARWNNMRDGEERLKEGYKLANMLYQSSYEGDCWWLTQYGWSCTQDSTLAGNHDMVEEAIRLLEDVSVKTTDFKLKEKSLYALAYIHRDPWYFEGWDEKNSVWYDYDNPLIRPNSRQYMALKTLGNFAKANKGKLDNYVTKCDVLKRFMTIVK